MHHELLWNSTSKMIELDIFLPDEKLAFEYQGEHHYNDIHTMGNKWVQQQRDEEKRRKCTGHNITLIEVPYWWNNERSSLIATIHKHRPDLIPSTMVGNGVTIEENQESVVGIAVEFAF